MISVAKLKRSIVVAFIVAGLGTGAVAPTVTQAASTNSSSVIKIVFPKGSFCGSYSGRIGSGRTFRLGLGANQTLVVRTLGGSHTIAWVRGPYGYLDGYKPDDESTEYETDATGWHYVRITAHEGSGSIQFCAY